MGHDDGTNGMDGTHDMTEVTGATAEQALHGALCALALGELGADEARALEARLAAEPALAAQLDEVRATIALVRTSLAGDEALPAAGLERVLASARERASVPPAPLPALRLAWYRRPAVRLAASLVIFAGAGFVGLKALQSGERAGTTEFTARLEAPVDAMVEGPRSSAEPLGAPAVEPVTIDSLTASGRANLRAYTTGGIRQNGEPKHVDPDTETQANGGFNSGAVVPGAHAGVLFREAEQLALGRASQPDGAALQQAPEAAWLAPGTTGYFAAGGGGGGGATELASGSKLELQQLGYATQDVGGLPPIPAERPIAFYALTVAPDAALAPTGGTRELSVADPSSGSAPANGVPKNEAPGTKLPELTELRAGLEAKSVNERLVDTPLAALTELGKAPVDSYGLVDGRTAGVPAEPAPIAPAADPAAAVPARDSIPPRDPSDVDARRKLAEVDTLQRELLRYTDESASGNPRLSEEQLAALVEQEWRRIHDDCRRRPNERPRDMYFRFWGDNAFVPTVSDAQSTFGADVDTASYALARRYLREGHAPERAQIRTEEFVNAFTPDLAAPAEGTFGLHVELAPTPFGEDRNHWLVRVGVRGKEVAKADRQPLNLVFVVDTSGSMREQNRLELVKHAMRLLVTQLEARDTLSIVAYANEARQVLAPTSAAHRDLIESAIHPLTPNGSTNAEAGLRMGYALAETMLAPNTHNRVVFLSDGVANVGQTDQDRLNEDVKRFRDRGVYLNTIGVGMNNHNDAFLEQLANKGDGICDYVDDAVAAEKAIVERFSGAFVPIASDVKLQVEFDPAQVLRWRQLGYENRAIADHDFRNDKVDAGEVGAGHQVTCLYEVELAEGLDAAEAAKALATLRVRWKAPKVAGQDPLEFDVFERESTLSYGARAASFREASLGFRRAALAAQFAEVLRRSTHARLDDYGALVTELGALIEVSPKQGRLSSEFTNELAELADLVRRADGLGFGQRPALSDLERTLDEYRRYQVLRATLEDLKRTDDPLLRQIEDTNRTIEQQIRDVLRRDLSRQRG